MATKRTPYSGLSTPVNMMLWIAGGRDLYNWTPGECLRYLDYIAGAEIHPRTVEGVLACSDALAAELVDQHPDLTLYVDMVRRDGLSTDLVKEAIERACERFVWKIRMMPTKHPERFKKHTARSPDDNVPTHRRRGPS